MQRKLYHPSDKVADITERIHDLLVDSSVIRIDFDGRLELGGLKVKYIEPDPACIILVHWEPDYSVSRQEDPCCSTLVLRYNSLQKLYREVQMAIEADDANEVSETN